MDSDQDAAGQAALSICESILVSLRDKGIIPIAEAKGALEDAASMHPEATRLGPRPQRHAQANRRIERMLARCNPV